MALTSLFWNILLPAWEGSRQHQRDWWRHIVRIKPSAASMPTLFIGTREDYHEQLRILVYLPWLNPSNKCTLEIQELRIQNRRWNQSVYSCSLFCFFKWLSFNGLYLALHFNINRIRYIFSSIDLLSHFKKKNHFNFIFSINNKWIISQTIYNESKIFTSLMSSSILDNFI